jgi:hypothetical protein
MGVSPKKDALESEVIDGQNPEGQKRETLTLTPREEKMAELVAQHNDTLSEIPDGEADTHPDVREQHKTAQDYNKGLYTESNVDSSQKVADNKSAKADSAPSTSESAVYYVDGVAMMKLKVKGEEIEMPLDKVQGIAQKNIYADVRLRNAAETEKGLQAREQQIAERERRAQESLTQPSRQDVGGSEEDVSVSAKTFIDTLFDGSREEAVEKAAQFLTRPTTSAVDQDALFAKVSEVASAQVLRDIQQREDLTRQNNFNSSLQRGLANVEKEYPQLVQDDVLFDLVDRRTESISQANPDMTPEEVMGQAAAEIAERLNLPRTTARPPAEPRSARKANLKPVPRAAVSTRYQARAEPEVDMSQTAVLERMRQARAGLGHRT